ncbi:MAG: sulfatase-like hydrolase/transferase, partial [Nocardioides sp.]
MSLRRHVLMVAATTAVLMCAGLLSGRTGVEHASAWTEPVQGRTSATTQPTPPNVVMIVVDDMRADELRWMPRARRLIGGQGVRFVNSFAPYPLCCPARASYFTGQYTHNHRVFDVKEPYAFPALDDRSTLATWLREAGYRTNLVGKYMNGYGRLPERGTDTGDSLDYVPPGWSNWRASLENGALPRSHPDYGHGYLYFNTTLSRNGHGFRNYRGQYQSEVYGDISTRIIRRQAAFEAPFFLYASYT